MNPYLVLIGSPIRQSAEILRAYLTSLEELNTRSCEVGFVFMDDNVSGESQQCLRQFQEKHPRTHIRAVPFKPYIYGRFEETHYWGEETMWKVGGMKDDIIAYAIEQEVDYLFLVDSDLILHPETLEQLISAQKDIISNIFWTKWQPDGIEMPQVWLTDEYTLFRRSRKEHLTPEMMNQRKNDFLDLMRTPGIHEVGGLGACTLISREAMVRGVRFAEIQNLSFWGEDRHFSIRAQAMGFSLFVDTHYPAYHVFRQSDIGGINLFKRSVKPLANKDRKISISLCLIVKNEENALPECLKSVAGIPDEIIIVDTGSTDRTKELAAGFTDKIYDFVWIDDFAAARNFAFSKATKDYILWLDADDIVEGKDRLLFLELIRTMEPLVDRVTMPYNLSFDANGNVSSSLRRNRLVRRACQFQWIGAVHEYLAAFGSVLNSDVAITHRKDKEHTDRNLRIYRNRLAQGEQFGPRDTYYFANELREHGHYQESIDYYEQFLRSDGWVEDKINATLFLGDCHARLQDRDAELLALLRAFELDRPRAETCCRIGAVFLHQASYDKAIYWYEQAYQTPNSSDNIALSDRSTWTWLPHVQLCLCYDRVGQPAKAKQHNDIAYSYNPTHPAILHNKKYFDSIMP